MLADAEEDLFDICTYVAADDSPPHAEALLKDLESTCGSLANLPNRGRIPPELKSVGVSDYSEILFKHYRIVYRVEKNTVYVYAILDGRRELTELLHRRLLR